jgi:hypothetical protein
MVYSYNSRRFPTFRLKIRCKQSRFRRDLEAKLIKESLRS